MPGPFSKDSAFGKEMYLKLFLSNMEYGGGEDSLVVNCSCDTVGEC